MGKLNLISACLVSFPEDLLLLVVSLLIVGIRDILNIKNKSNLFKMFVSALLMTVVTVMLKNFLGQSATVISLSVFVVIYVFVLRVHWIEATAGVLIAAIVFMTLEYGCILVGSQVLGIHFDGSSIDSRLRIFLSVAPRLLQVILAVVLYKIPVAIINLGPIKTFSKSKLKKMALICLCEALYIVVILKVARFDYDTTTILGILDMASSIVLILSFAVVNIVVAIKLMDAIREEKRNRAIALFWVDSLLKKHGNDIIKIREEVEMALNKAAREFERE